MFSRLLLFLIVFLIFGCISKPKSKLVLLKAESDISIRLKSSCKKSAFDSISSDQKLKMIIKETKNKGIKEAKIKSCASEKKSTYLIKSAQLVVSERCGAKTASGKPFIGLQYILTIQNLKTNDTLNFSSDTSYIYQDNLNSLVPKKINLTTYLPSLTKNTLSQIKNHFR